MSFKLQVKKTLCHLSEKVKSVDLHSQNPWVLSSLYTGIAQIYNYEAQTTVKSFEVSEDHLRTGIFIPNKNWIAVAGDDKKIRIFNYNTLEKLEEKEAHDDFVRSIAAHPEQKLLLSGSDDYSIKLWSYDDKGKLTLKKTFVEHQNFVMKVKFNPKEPNYFASCSIDTTIKIWNINSTSSNITLKEHESGVNGFDFYPGEQPYLASGSDDHSVKIWDLQQRKCLYTLSEHEDTVANVAYHPEMPYLLSASEDGNVIIWNTNSLKSQQVINYYLQKSWDIVINPNNAKMIAMAYDEGTVVVKFGGDEQKASLKKGKLIMAKNYDIFSTNLKAIPKPELVDGAVIQLKQKELGRTDIYPLTIKHSPNGIMLVITDNSEFVIYKAQSFKNLQFGSGNHFVWSNDNGYAVVKNGNVDVFDKDFNQVESIDTDYPIEGLFGGAMLGVHSSDFVLFYSWQGGNLIQKVEIVPKEIIWNKTGDLVSIVGKESFFLLRYQREKVEEVLENLAEDEELEDGVDDCFDVISEVADIVESGIWIEEVFFFLNNVNKLNYIVKEKPFNYAYIQNSSQILGHVKNQNRLYFSDQKNKVLSQELPIDFAKGITAIVQEDKKGLEKSIKKLKDQYIDKIARFLEGTGDIETAFSIVSNANMKFSYAIRLGRIEDAIGLAGQKSTPKMWKQIGDLSLQSGDFDRAEDCFKNAKDYGSLFMLYSSLGYKDGVEWLAQETSKQRFFSIAFNCYFMLRDVKNALECLISSKKLPEAAFFAKTYIPSEISRVVVLWRESLAKTNPVISQSLADPMEYEDDEQFSGLFLSDKVENIIRQKIQVEVPANNFQLLEEKLNVDLYQMANDEGLEAVGNFSFGLEDPVENGVEENGADAASGEGEEELE